MAALQVFTPGRVAGVPIEVAYLAFVRPYDLGRLRLTPPRAGLTLHP